LRDLFHVTNEKIKTEERATGNEPVFCLRQKNSQQFWSGSQWAAAQDAKPFSNLDSAFNVARHVGGSLDLLVLFPANTGQLVIPLAQFN
jgi:hypothetical protein